MRRPTLAARCVRRSSAAAILVALSTGPAAAAEVVTRRTPAVGAGARGPAVAWGEDRRARGGDARDPARRPGRRRPSRPGGSRRRRTPTPPAASCTRRGIRPLSAGDRRAPVHVDDHRARRRLRRRDGHERGRRRRAGRPAAAVRQPARPRGTRRARAPSGCHPPSPSTALGGDRRGGRDLRGRSRRLHLQISRRGRRHHDHGPGPRSPRRTVVALDGARTCCGRTTAPS